MSESILQRVAQGDESAVAECLTRYGGLVLSLALRWVGPDRATAEDVTQEIFLEILKSARRFDSNLASEATFVTLIARRRLIDNHRRRQRQPPPGSLPENIPCPRSLDPDPLEVQDEADRALRILSEIEPEERRKVLLMAIHQGLTHEQIARATGIPLGTVKSHARRGLYELRARLRDANLVCVRKEGS